MNRSFPLAFVLVLSAISLACGATGNTVFDSARRPIPREHPRLLGSAEELRQLALERPEAYTRMSEIVSQRMGGRHERMVSCALVYVIEGDENCGREDGGLHGGLPSRKGT